MSFPVASITGPPSRRAFPGYDRGADDWQAAGGRHWWRHRDPLGDGGWRQAVSWPDVDIFV